MATNNILLSLGGSNERKNINAMLFHLP